MSYKTKRKARHQRERSPDQTLRTPESRTPEAHHQQENSPERIPRTPEVRTPEAHCRREKSSDLTPGDRHQREKSPSQSLRTPEKELLSKSGKRLAEWRSDRVSPAKSIGSSSHTGSLIQSLTKQGQSNILCKVCGDEASTVHAGVLTCHPCRSFFKRSLKGSINRKYMCDEKNCLITKHTRKICDYCHYQKCLNLGMGKNASRSSSQHLRDKTASQKSQDTADDSAYEDSLDKGLCRVCQREASGVHYGVLTCRNCSVFFSKSCGQDNFNNYQCSLKECNIARIGGRSSCSFCRYQQCLRVGMSKALSKRGRRRKADETSSEKSIEVSIQGRRQKVEALSEKSMEGSIRGRRQKVEALSEKSMEGSIRGRQRKAVETPSEKSMEGSIRGRQRKAVETPSEKSMDVSIQGRRRKADETSSEKSIEVKKQKLTGTLSLLEKDKKQKLNNQRQKVSKNIPCVVCGDVSCEMYCGLWVCHCCCKFFKHSLEENLHDKYKCKYGDRCVVNKISRETCHSCRFKKCLTVGMVKIKKDLEEKKKKEPVKKFEQTVMLCNPRQFPCKVCGDLASGIHYGQFICEGCKGFYRRSTHKSVNYFCIGKDCIINKMTRTRCAYCRYQKCLRLGMSKEACKKGRRTKSKQLTLMSQPREECQVYTEEYRKPTSRVREWVNSVNPLAPVDEPQVEIPEIVYLDYNATTPHAPEVLEAITRTLRNDWYNPSSSYDRINTVKDTIEDARQQVADMIGASVSEIVFTSGGTESNNMILQSALKYYHDICSPDLPSSHKDSIPHFVSTSIEHDSVKLVLKHFEKEKKAEVTFVPPSRKTGCIQTDDIIKNIRPNTVMVTIMAANNITGIIQPIADISKQIRALKRKSGETKYILIHSDAAQMLGKVCVDINDMAVDYLTIVGHKFYGPRIGAIFARNPRSRIPLYPLLQGGPQEHNFRPGTENTGMIAGLGMASILVKQNLHIYNINMEEIRDYLEEKLVETFGENGVKFNGRKSKVPRLPNTCNVSILDGDLEGRQILAEVKRIRASVGAACHSSSEYIVPEILLASGIRERIAKSSIRLSIGRETTRKDIDDAVEDLKEAVAVAKSKKTD